MFHNKSFFYFLFLSFLIGCIFFSCKKISSPSWDVDVVAPIARGTLNIKNFFGDSLFQSDNAHVLHLKFFKKVGEIKIDTLVKLPDTTISYTFAAFYTATVNPNTLLFYKTDEVNFNVPNGARLRYGTLKSATLKVKYSNTTRQPLLFLYTLNSATKNNTPYFISEIIPPGASSLTKYYNFDNYDLDLTGQYHNEFNTIAHSFTVYTAPNAQPDSIKFGQGVVADISYENFVPQYVEGYFGQQTINIPYDSAALGFSKNLKATNFQLNSAYINFLIENDFGVDIQGDLDTVKSINHAANNAVLLNALALHHININRATKSGNAAYPVNTTTTTISLNFNNSNLKPFIENLPDYLAYKGKININPYGNVSGTNDFAFYNTGIRIFADVDIPMNFSADYFYLQNNLAINFSNVPQLNNVNDGKMIFNITNHYPFKVKMQAYLLDDHQTVLDSLLLSNGNTVDMAYINTNNDVIAPKNSQLIAYMNKTTLMHLQKSKYIKIISYVYLPPSPPTVNIYDNYYIDVVITVDVNYRTSN